RGKNAAEAIAILKLTNKASSPVIEKVLMSALGTALATKGIGASLQHYNPLVDEMTSNEFNIPKSWKLIAQMPFGDIREAAGEKTFNPVEDRFVIKK
ncbi:hypothetical protein ACQKH8_05110, partial [Staphylococcus aureus]